MKKLFDLLLGFAIIFATSLIGGVVASTVQDVDFSKKPIIDELFRMNCRNVTEKIERCSNMETICYIGKSNMACFNLVEGRKNGKQRTY